MEWQSILWTVLSIVLTALVSWGVERLIAFINSKISNTKYAKYLTDAVEVVTRAVKSTYQTYVQSLKGENMFDESAQKEALSKAKDMAMSQLSTGLQSYISQNFGDVETWLCGTIESVIYDLKNTNKSSTVAENTNGKA